MKGAFTLAAFLFVVHAQAQADVVPSGVQCLKPLRGQGMTMEDAYQACSLSDSARKCVLTQQKMNAKVAKGTELARLGREAIEKCKAMK
jgi:hypothetical protein